MDSDFYFNLYRRKTVTKEAPGNKDSKILRLSYIWLNQFIPSAYAATLENITVWSANQGAEATQTEPMINQAMENFDAENFQKACKEFN